jgi:hypothetical protein
MSVTRGVFYSGVFITAWFTNSGQTRLSSLLFHTIANVQSHDESVFEVLRSNRVCHESTFVAGPPAARTAPNRSVHAAAAFAALPLGHPLHAKRAKRLS